MFWYYGSGAIAFGIKNNAIAYMLLPFATQALGLPGYLAALALAVATVADALTDLLIGYWSDQTSSRIGRRHPFMFAALILLPLSFWFMFNPWTELTDVGLFWYVLVFAILIRTSTTFMEVPSVAQLPELESNYERRSRWLSIRVAFGWLGGNGLHTVNLFFWVGAYGLSVKTGYSIYAGVGASLIALTILISSLGTLKHFSALPRPTKEDHKGLWEAMRHTLENLYQSLRNRNFLVLFLNGLLTGIAGGMFAALYLYNVTYFFGFSGPQVAITGLFVLVSPFLAVGIIPVLTHYYEKRNIAITAIVGFIFLTPIPYLCFLVDLWPPMGSMESLIIYSVFIMVDVVLLMINGTMLDSMTADVVEDSEINTSRRTEGLFYASRGFANKAMGSGGVILAGTIVSIVGMESFETATDMTFDHRVQLVLLAIPIYCALHLLAISMFKFYRIDRGQHQENLEKLEERKQTPVSGRTTPIRSV